MACYDCILKEQKSPCKKLYKLKPSNTDQEATYEILGVVHEGNTLKSEYWEVCMWKSQFSLKGQISLEVQKQ